MNRSQGGSILFYILLAVVLFGALSYAAANMFRGGGDISTSERAKINSQALADYAQKVKLTVQDMKLRGVATDQLSFLISGDAGYTTAPHTVKVFHPEGGGVASFLLIEHLKDASVTAPYMRAARVSNGGLGTAAADIMVGFRNLQQPVCAELNSRLNNTTTIPTATLPFGTVFPTSGTGDINACADCSGKSQYCFQNIGTGEYIFYTVIDEN